MRSRLTRGSLAPRSRREQILVAVGTHVVMAAAGLIQCQYDAMVELRNARRKAKVWPPLLRPDQKDSPSRRLKLSPKSARAVPHTRLNWAWAGAAAAHGGRGVGGRRDTQQDGLRGVPAVAGAEHGRGAPNRNEGSTTPRHSRSGGRTCPEARGWGAGPARVIADFHPRCESESGQAPGTQGTAFSKTTYLPT